MPTKESDKVETPTPVETPTTPTKKAWYENKLYVILWLVFFFPVGIYGVWKTGGWSKRTRWILTALPAIFILWSMITASMAAPVITTSGYTANQEVDSQDYKVAGQVLPAGSKLKVNEVDVKVETDGKFAYTLKLKDGQNEIIISATNSGKTVEVKETVKKLTADEIAKRKATADADAKVKADADAKANAEKAAADAKAAAVANAPAEYKSALSQATTYAKTMHLSKQGVYDQLVSEYGGKFSAAAAQYAIDNVSADWNANALSQGKTYQDTMHLSPVAVHDQLTSEYGGKFTKSEADYAIQHLND